MAGRGFGKTRAGIEYIRSCIEGDTPLTAAPGAPEVTTIIGDTPSDIRDFIVDGPGGFKRNCPPWATPVYQKSNRRLTWPNGCYAILFSAEDPDAIRGASGSLAWCDELGKWRYQEEAWRQLMFSLREGDRPRVIVTTTPRPTKVLKEILAADSTVTTTGTSYDNRANLNKVYFEKAIAPYEGTRFGNQEILGQLLTDNPKALWQAAQLDELREPAMSKAEAMARMVRIVVAVDPPASSTKRSDECGIIVGGVDKAGHGYVLEDLSEQGLTPSKWAVKACKAYEEWSADRIVAEVNNGGDMVENTIRQVNPNAAYKSVWASRGKVIRAEPISALYEQGRVHHVGGFAKLEDQMVDFTTDFDRQRAGYSPDRVDALVWCMTDLIQPHTEWRIY